MASLRDRQSNGPIQGTQDLGEANPYLLASNS